MKNISRCLTVAATAAVILITTADISWAYNGYVAPQKSVTAQRGHARIQRKGTVKTTHQAAHSIVETKKKDDSFSHLNR